ncbi:MAG TPA: elongation factor 4 [Elusimicrobia bacterium]|jgi:GTP-binding protein LepA|nr:elongation factor 4 [Elusimicrobiota bacterium]
MKNIRNFSIIAHIDHGKSTLADRFLEYTGLISQKSHQPQILDGLELERERGITIKAKTVRLNYVSLDGKNYIFNLIDTPGHVDFTYEVSRALAACEGCLLLIDASQGVEAQTLANFELARKNNLVVIPVVNKIDLPQTDIEGTKKQIKEILGIEEEPLLASAKQGLGTEEILETIVKKIRPPYGSTETSLEALVFDSFYDPFRGVVLYVKILEGKIFEGQKIQFISSGGIYEVNEVGYLQLKMVKSKSLFAGEVGYCIAGIKDIHQVKIGDLLIEKDSERKKTYPGFREVKPYVFSGFYPLNPADYPHLQLALEKLHLTDSSFYFIPENSQILGAGFRCGFLGVLHLEIVKERLKREFRLELLVTSPNVIYQVRKINGEVIEINHPIQLPPINEIKEIEENYVSAMIVTPKEYVGAVMNMLDNRQAKFKTLRYISSERVLLYYELPLAEIVYDFYDQLKSVTQGYASFDYEIIGFRKSDLVKLEILVNHQVVDAFSFLIHRDNAYNKGNKLVEKLSQLIPRHLFSVPIQARVNNKIIARENIPPLRKDVTAKCYGGDITRKRKLLQKQKEGKKKMQQFGEVNIPPEAFFSIFKT